MVSRKPFEPGWMAAKSTRCYSTPSCRAGINNSSPLSPQLWTSQEPSTAWNLYASSTTQLSVTDWSSEPIKVTREVKQGDPLSPVIFNLVIGQLLRSLPQECGSTYNGKTSCHGLRGRSGSSRRLANRSTTSTRLDEYLPGDLWPTLEHEQVSYSLDRR